MNWASNHDGQQQISAFVNGIRNRQTDDLWTTIAAKRARLEESLQKTFGPTGAQVAMKLARFARSLPPTQ